MKVFHTVLKQNIKLAWASIHGETQQTKGLDNQPVTMAATVQIQELSAFPIYLSWVSFKKNKKSMEPFHNSGRGLIYSHGWYRHQFPWIL